MTSIAWLTLTLLPVLALASPALLAQNQFPIIDPFTNRTVNANETECLTKLNWPKCFGWNLRNSTLKDDPGFEKWLAQTCSPECEKVKASISRQHVESVCGPNPILPRRYRLERLELNRIRAQYGCTMDDTGKRPCAVLVTETWQEVNFNASLHTGPDGDQHAPWSAVPKDYACSKCVLEDIEIEKQVDEWYKTQLNITTSLAFYDRSEKGMKERAELCKDWKPRAITASPSANASGGGGSGAQPDPSSALILSVTPLTALLVVIAAATASL